MSIWLLTFLVATIASRLYAVFETGAQFFWWDGLWHGLQAKKILEGGSWSAVFWHPFSPQDGGSVLCTYLTVPFFAVFGDTFFSLELVALLFTLLICVVLYNLVKKHFGQGAAVAASCFLIFPPIDFLIFSMTNGSGGSHFRGTLFSLTILLLFFDLFLSMDESQAGQKASAFRRKRTLLLLGLIAGLGTYVTYDTLVILAVLCVTFALMRMRINRMEVTALVIGFLIGVSPYLVAYPKLFLRKFCLHGAPILQLLFSKNPLEILGTFVYFTTSILPREFGMPWYVALIVAMAYLASTYAKKAPDDTLSRLYRKKMLIITGYVLLFLLVIAMITMTYAVTRSLRVDLATRIFPVYPFLFILTAAGIQCALRKFCGQRLRLYRLLLAVFCVAVILIPGSLRYKGFVLQPRMRRLLNPFKVKGYVSNRFLDLKVRQPTTNLVEADVQYFTRRTANFWMSLFARDSLMTDFQAPFFTSIMRRADKTEKPKLYYILGANLGFLITDYRIKPVIPRINYSVPIEYKHCVWEGMTLALTERRLAALLKDIDFLREIPREYRHYFLLRVGALIARAPESVRNQHWQLLRERLFWLTPQERNYLMQGFSEGLVVEYARGTEMCPATVPHEYRSYFYRALGLETYRRFQNQAWPMEPPPPSCTDPKEKKQFYCGSLEGFLMTRIITESRLTPNMLSKILTADWFREEPLYDMLGSAIGSAHFGYLDDSVRTLLNQKLSAAQQAQLYGGYALSLRERFGGDRAMLKHMIDVNVPRQWRFLCYRQVSQRR